MKNFQNQYYQNSESQAAQLAVIAGVITTLGEALATIATAIALQETEQNPPNNADIRNLQKQMDDIQREIKQIKYMLQSKIL